MTWLLFEEVGQQFVNGLTLAAIYALIAVGVSLFFGAIGIVNLAHGDVAAFATFAALAVQKLLNSISPMLGAILGIPVGMGIGAIVGWVLYRFAFRPLGNAPAVIGLLAAIAAGFVVRESIFNFFPNGRNPQTFKSVVPNNVFEFAGIFIQVSQIFVIGSAIAICIALAAIIQGTSFGRAIRSVVNNREAARTLGVSVNATLSRTFLLGGALAGVAGVLNGTYYSIVQFDMGVMLTIKGFVAAVIGGLGNIYGALIGAVIIGLLESFTAGFLPNGNAYKDVVVFGTLIFILVLRPEGILGHGGINKA